MHEGDHKFYTPQGISTISITTGFKEDRKPKNVARFMVKIIYRKL